jgi:hypothetical protein
MKQSTKTFHQSLQELRIENFAFVRKEESIFHYTNHLKDIRNSGHFLMTPFAQTKDPRNLSYGLERIVAYLSEQKYFIESQLAHILGRDLLLGLPLWLGHFSLAHDSKSLWNKKESPLHCVEYSYISTPSANIWAAPCLYDSKKWLDYFDQVFQIVDAMPSEDIITMRPDLMALRLHDEREIRMRLVLEEVLPFTAWVRPPEKEDEQEFAIVHFATKDYVEALQSPWPLAIGKEEILRGKRIIERKVS